MSVDTSALSGSGSSDPVQAAVQVSLLKKSQDIEAAGVQTMLDSMKAVSPAHLGLRFDKVA